jgi:hypothetical protein
MTVPHSLTDTPERILPSLYGMIADDITYAGYPHVADKYRQSLPRRADCRGDLSSAE